MDFLQLDQLVKLDLFIKDSQKEVSLSYEWEKFDKHFILGDLFEVKTNSEINLTEKQNPWFFVLYDNEIIEEDLAVALRTFLLTDLQVVKFYKRESETIFSIQPRLFRSEIVLPESGLLPEGYEQLKMETCLNGFLYSC